MPKSFVSKWDMKVAHSKFDKEAVDMAKDFVL